MFVEVDPTDSRVLPLVSAHLAYSEQHSPSTSCHTMDAEELSAENIRFFALFEGEMPVACGALMATPANYVEVKSVHVLRTARGRGHARALMNHLIGIAKSEGYHAMTLETGSAQLAGYDAARALYESLGFRYCDPIHGYVADGNSSFMQLTL